MCEDNNQVKRGGMLWTWKVKLYSASPPFWLSCKEERKCKYDCAPDMKMCQDLGHDILR